MNLSTLEHLFPLQLGSLLIGLGGIALAFTSVGAQLLSFGPVFVFMILTPLLLLMTTSMTIGFVKDIKG
jgi:flagellar biosynthesis protein FliQ